jgi:hypothetical protein
LRYNNGVTALATQYGPLSPSGTIAAGQRAGGAVENLMREHLQALVKGLHEGSAKKAPRARPND